MQINLTGLDENGFPGLDGEYHLDPQPNLRELTRFRKEAGLSPSEMLEILSGTSLELLPLYVYTALQRRGQADLASKVFDIPFDLWGGADFKGDVEPEADGGDGGEEDESKLPPPPGSDENESENYDDESSGRTSLDSSALPV